jgi:hypothetical protein
VNLHAKESEDIATIYQMWKGLMGYMQLHENRPMKRAGVVGIALRGE